MLAMELNESWHDALTTAVPTKLAAVVSTVDEQRFGGKDVSRGLRWKDTDVRVTRGRSQHDEIEVKRFPSNVNVFSDVRGAKMSSGSPSVVMRLSLTSSEGNADKPTNALAGKPAIKFIRKSNEVSDCILLKTRGSMPVMPAL